MGKLLDKVSHAIPVVTTPVINPAISIIIPLSAFETAWQTLLPALRSQISPDDEIILAAQAPITSDTQKTLLEFTNTRWINCKKQGRAAQMNECAALANNHYLWFIHADTQLTSNCVCALKTSLKKQPNALHYFRLKFYDGDKKMKLNEWGVQLRCALFSNPFGDQAFALSTTLFFDLNGYEETAAYGEDHLLTIKARANGIALQCVASTVLTSARRYTQQGWLKTILLFQTLWIKQWINRSFF